MTIHTREQLLARRAEILATAQMSETEMLRRAAIWQLSPTELALADELRRIDWLLGAEVAQ